MHDLVKNLTTEEEFNTLSEDTRNTIEDEARKAEEDNFFKIMNDPNILAEMKAVFTKYGYDYNIFNAMKNTLK